MTTKKKFEAENPTVIVLANGRYAYRVKCPWEGKNGKELYAFKFCSTEAHRRFHEAKALEEADLVPSDEQTERPESPTNSDLTD
jgi:hypothetical protein